MSLDQLPTESLLEEAQGKPMVLVLGLDLEGALKPAVAREPYGIVVRSVQDG